MEVNNVEFEASKFFFQRLESVVFQEPDTGVTRNSLYRTHLCLEDYLHEYIHPPTSLWADNSKEFVLDNEEAYFGFVRAMNYSDDIEMWDFEQILDSPLSALTADFAKFKKRFSRIFDSNPSIPSVDSDSETTSLASNMSASRKVHQELGTGKEAAQGSTQYRPQPAKRKMDKHKKGRQHNIEQSNRHHHQQRENQQQGIRLGTKTLTSCLGSNPAKRPTDLPVIPHVITDEYLTAMKTKGYSSADNSTRPRDQIQVYPRLTQSYLEHYHNVQSGGSPDYTEAVHDWQFNKYKQEVQDSSHNQHDDANIKDSRQGVRFRANYLQSPADTDSISEGVSNGMVGAYLSQDNKLFKQDSWKGPSTPHPKKSGIGASLGATHRGTHRFVPRHNDEMSIEIGDSIHVLDEAEDGWCMGINLTSQMQGLFPSVYATDLEFYEINENGVKQPPTKLYKLHFLGSMEVNHHKGSDVLIDAIEKIILNRRLSKDTTTPPLCQLEVSEAGIKMIDLTHKKRTKKLVTDMNVDSASERLSKLLAFSKETKAVSNHFFSLKHISFCGYHPDNPRYFGFITKHPTQKRFACHCYSSVDESTQQIVDAVGDAFQNYYCGYIPPLSDSSDDLYIE